MRCLTLADALSGVGCKCHFITRERPGNLTESIQSRGHIVHILPCGNDTDYGPHPARPTHSKWLLANWRKDAADCLRLACELGVEWLVVDHYALDAEWEEHALPASAKLLVIDDLADRPHSSPTLLLDQNYGRRPADYGGLVPKASRLLIGPRYALLRPEFRAAREAGWTNRDGSLGHLLITLGGVDQENWACEILTALCDIELPEGLEISVVLGKASPWRVEVETLASKMPRETKVFVGVSDMARRMTDADLCIGAAGSTALERCCVGLPTGLVVLAENQSLVAKALSEFGACKQLSTESRSLLVEQLRALLMEDARSMRAEMSRLGAEVCDGRGTHRVVLEILAAGIQLTPATSEHAEPIWRWRHMGAPWVYFKNAEPTAFSDHEVWYKAALRNPQIHLLIASLDSAEFGYVRFDRLSEHSEDAEISLCLMEEVRGQGLGTRLIAAAVRRARELGIRTLVAEVKSDNIGSLKAFKKCGFVTETSDTKFQILKLQTAIN